MDGTPVGEPKNRALIARAKNILVTPKEEWPRIDGEAASTASLYTGYILPLAAIPPVAGLIGALAFGYSAFGITYRPTIGAALTSAVIQYAAALIGILLLALIIDFLAPRFGGTANRVQAMKVAAYSATAGFVGGIFGVLPSLAFLGALLGLYGIYLLYLGLPVLMKAPQEKAGTYTVAVLAVGLVVALLGGLVLGPVIARFSAPPSLNAPNGEISGSLNVPGVGSVDLGKLEQAAKQLEAQNNNGKPIAAIPADQLQALLPETLQGLPRTEISSSSAEAGGIGGSRAEASYAKDDASVRLEITDLAAMGGLASLGSALNVQSSQQSATGYEKVGTVDGRMTTEKWDRESKGGSFGVLVANRFMVQADGDGLADIAPLKAAVAGVDFGKLESLSR